MAKTVVGVFDTISEAQRAVTDLTSAGFSRDDLSLVAGESDEAKSVIGGGQAGNEKSTAVPRAAAGAGIGAAAGILAGLVALAIPGVGPVLAAGPLAATLLGGAAVGAATGGLIGAMTGVGIPEEHAHHYAEAVRRGSVLVMVNAPDERAQEAAEVMNRAGAIDVMRRAARWEKTEGYKRFDVNAAPLAREQRERERETNVRHYNQGERVIPVVEEEVKVGKREVERGGVRVYTRVTEQPVSEQVRLREERVQVERRPVDRPVTSADATALREGTVEVKARSEEAVVAKQARVVEEVVVSKSRRARRDRYRYGSPGGRAGRTDSWHRCYYRNGCAAVRNTRS